MGRMQRETRRRRALVPDPVRCERLQRPSGPSSRSGAKAKVAHWTLAIPRAALDFPSGVGIWSSGRRTGPPFHFFSTKLTGPSAQKCQPTPHNKSGNTGGPQKVTATREKSDSSLGGPESRWVLLFTRLISGPVNLGPSRGGRA
jgi:hypothetical protein